MAYTDHAVTAYIFPQDGAYSGISDFDSDWANAAYVGGLALAQGSDYTPRGVDVTPDYGGNQFSISAGLSFIEDSGDIDFRNWDDSEKNRSGTWTSGYLTAMHVKAESGISFETTTGTNHVWLGFSRTSQNDGFIRVADTDTDAPSIGVKIEEIDAGNSTSSPKNRVAGYSWDFLGKDSTGGDVSQASVSWPENGYDEYKMKFIDVGGTGTSSGTNLQGRVNNHNANYWYRTTQNNTQGSNHFKILQGRPDEMHIGGHLYFSMDGGYWAYDNRTTSNEEKQTSFSGHNKSAADVNPINSVQLYWTAGDINGEWNIWGRNKL